MWIAVWISFLNAMASGSGFINVLRVNVGGVPMGILEISVAVAFVIAVCTQVFQSRGALHFALLCGMAIRAREIQEATRQVAQDYPELPPELAAEGVPGMMLATDGPF
jgi:hypothetical protein